MNVDSFLSIWNPRALVICQGVGRVVHKGPRPRSDKSVVQSPITGKVGQFVLLLLTRVKTKDQRDVWYEYINRYHYLGYQLPFGAQFRYFIETGKEQKTILGCLQFSSPAWKMAPRDRWIQWNNEQRKQSFIERLWRSVKYEEIYLKEYATVKELIIALK